MNEILLTRNNQNYNHNVGQAKRLSYDGRNKQIIL